MAWLKYIYDDVRRRGLDVYLALFFGVMAFGIGVFGGSVDVIVDITAGVLALIAFSLFQGRERIETLRQDLTPQIESIKRGIGELQREVYRSDTIELDSYKRAVEGLIDSAKGELLILAHTGSTITGTGYYANEIIDAYRRGCRIRIIISSIKPDVVQMAEYRSGSGRKAPDITDGFRRTMANLARMQQRNQDSAGSLEVRVVDYIAPQKLYVADPQSFDGELIVVLGTFRASTMFAPHLRVNRADDLPMFEFFRQQFEQYWEAAYDYALTQSSDGVDG